MTDCSAAPWELKMQLRCNFCGGRDCIRCSDQAYLRCKNPAFPGLHSNWITSNIIAMQRPSDEIIANIDLITKFKEANVTAIFNLTEPGEHPYCGFGLKASGFPYTPDNFMAAGIKHFNYSWPDMSVPSPSLMMDIVQIAKSELNQGGKIAVHCHAGNGRTGLAIVCILVSCGEMSPWEAILYCRKMRPKSVQTKEQEDFIVHFSDHYMKKIQIFSPIYTKNQGLKKDKTRDALDTVDESKQFRSVSIVNNNDIGNDVSCLLKTATSLYAFKSMSKALSAQSNTILASESLYYRSIHKAVYISSTVIKERVLANVMMAPDPLSGAVCGGNPEVFALAVGRRFKEVALYWNSIYQSMCTNESLNQSLSTESLASVSMASTNLSPPMNRSRSPIKAMKRFFAASLAAMNGSNAGSLEGSVDWGSPGAPGAADTEIEEQCEVEEAVVNESPVKTISAAAHMLVRVNGMTSLSDYSSVIHYLEEQANRGVYREWCVLLPRSSAKLVVRSVLSEVPTGVDDVSVVGPNDIGSLIRQGLPGRKRKPSSVNVLKHPGTPESHDSISTKSVVVMTELVLSWIESRSDAVFDLGILCKFVLILNKHIDSWALISSGFNVEKILTLYPCDTQVETQPDSWLAALLGKEIESLSLVKLNVFIEVFDILRHFCLGYDPVSVLGAGTSILESSICLIVLRFSVSLLPVSIRDVALKLYMMCLDRMQSSKAALSATPSRRPSLKALLKDNSSQEARDYLLIGAQEICTFLKEVIVMDPQLDSIGLSVNSVFNSGHEDVSMNYNHILTEGAIASASASLLLVYLVVTMLLKNQWLKSTAPLDESSEEEDESVVKWAPLRAPSVNK